MFKILSRTAQWWALPGLVQPLSLAKHGREVALSLTAHTNSSFQQPQEVRDGCWSLLTLAWVQREPETRCFYQIKEEVIKSYLFQSWMQIAEWFFIYPEYENKNVVKSRISIKRSPEQRYGTCQPSLTWIWDLMAWGWWQPLVYLGLSLHQAHLVVHDCRNRVPKICTEPCPSPFPT